MKKQFYLKKFHLLPYFFKCRGIIWQQIESFNFFINTDLKKIIYSFRKKISNENSFIFLKINKIKIGIVSDFINMMEIPITPQQCRISDLTYSASIYTDISYRLEGKPYIRFGLNFCKIPIMLQSKACILFKKKENQFFSLKECPLDPGGYFIIKGSEKVVLIQEQMSVNRINIEQDNHGYICAVINSSSENRKTRNVVVLKNKKFYYRNTIFIEDIPIFIIFKAIGFDKDKDIIEIIGTEFENLLEWTLFETRLAGVTSKMQAINYISQRLAVKISNDIKNSKNSSNNTNNEIKKHFYKIISKNLLPHIIIHETNCNEMQKKGIFISLMLRRILLTLDQPMLLDNKDYYGNKRLELAGQLISVLFEDLFKRVQNEMEKYQKIISSKSKNFNFKIVSSINQDLISNGLEYAFSTGNWSIKKLKLEKNGVTQALSRLSFISTISIVTKITSQNEKIRKITGPRSLQSSQWGMICPSDTPEGESCGLVKNLAILAHVSNKENVNLVFRICYDLGTETYFYKDLKQSEGFFKLTQIFLNGQYLGTHYRPAKFIFSLRSLRRSGMLGNYLSVFWDTFSRSIFIFTDSGRICRPLFVINLGKYKIKNFHESILKKKILFFKELIREGFLEFLDVNEQNNAFIAYNYKNINSKTTHLELAPEIILGVCGSLIPFLNHNQSPRNTYQCAMGKQSIGSIAYNQNQRCDTILSLLTYPQKPLVKTKTVYFSGNHRLNSGINACICILSFSSYDIEDSIVLNRSSIEKGFFRSVIFRKHKILLKNFFIKNFSSGFENGDQQINNKKNSNFNKNSQIKLPIFKNQKKNLQLFNDFESDFFSNLIGKEIIGEATEKIIFSSNTKEPFFVKLILRQTRKPEVGDKFSSRHGQKGICGLMSFQKDLPFSNEGLVPDLIMNPHGFPSRMTIGKIIELLGGKTTSICGYFTDGTPFLDHNQRHMVQKLETLGYSPKGKDFFFSGITGDPMVMDVFSGPVFYQRLKHMVKDKIHGRSQGARSNLTRQPTEGRSKGGGLRFGEMERDCLISYGSTELAIERLLISSDLFYADFDRQTGFLIENKNKKTSVSIKLPFACKLLFQELQSMNIFPRISFNNQNKKVNLI